MSDPAIDLLVAHGYKYNAEAGSWSKEGEKPAPVQEPHKGLSEHLAQATNGRVRIDPVTGNVGIGTAPVQEPVAPKPWEGLSRDEVLDIEETTTHPLAFYQAIEAKLKEKNT
jgi:hypothetical protein